MRKHVINKVYTGDLNSLEDIKQGELIIDDTFNNELISFKNDRGLFVSVETKTAVDKKINTKQNITDESLQTKTKEIVPAINEVLSEINIVQDTLEETEKELSANIDSINNTIDSINQDIQQNTNKINDVNTDLSSQINNVNKYVTEVTGELTTNVNNLVESTTESFTEVNKNIQDINIELNEKQDKEDSSLDTEDKTIVGAINELKDSVDSIKIPEFPEIFVSTVNGVSGNVSVPSFSDLLDLTNRIDSVVNDVTNNTDNINLLLDTKQDKEDSSLDTEDKTIVGAINEVNSKIPDISNLAKQSDLTSLTTKVNTNTSDISNLKNQVNTNTTNISNKQDKTDNSLVTTSKTVVGGINELKTNISSLAKQSDLSSLQTKVNTNTTNISTNTTNITSLTTKVNTNTSNISNLKNNKQDKSDSTLTTTTKTVVGGINELKSDIDNLELELDNKQDKSDNTLKTNTKTVVGGINELDSKLKAETFAGGLKVKLANNGTAIITNEGIRVLDSNNVEKIKLVDRNVNLSDFVGNKYEKQEQPEFNSITHVNNGSFSSTSKYEIPSNSYVSLSVSIVGNIEIISQSLGNLSKDYPKIYYFYINIGNDKFQINISIKKYQGDDTTKAIVDTVSSANNKCVVSKVDDKNISFKIENYSPSNINNKHEITYSVNTSYSSDNVVMTFYVSHKNNGYIKYVGTLKSIETNPKTIIGFNGFLNYYNTNGYFGAYHDGTNYQIVGKGKNNITYI